MEEDGEGGEGGEGEDGGEEEEEESESDDEDDVQITIGEIKTAPVAYARTPSYPRMSLTPGGEQISRFHFSVPLEGWLILWYSETAVDLVLIFDFCSFHKMRGP